jgi:hypothetical protein
MGIASNPIPERNYAGGGIVAFAKAGEVEDPNAPSRQEGESENDYMKRVQAVYSAGNAFLTPRNYNPIAKLGDLYSEYIGNPFAEGVKRFVNQTPEEQAAKFRSYSQQPKTEVPTVKTQPVKTEPGVKSLVEKPVDKLVEKPVDKKPQSPLQKATNAPEMPETKVDPIDALIASLTKKLEGDPEASAKAKKEAMWSRLAEAGLGIMGGTSTNFAENVGKGATQAMKGYAEDIKGIRAADNEKLNQLVGLGLKGAGLKQEARKLGITEQHYKDWLKVQTQQNSIMAGTRTDANQLRADTAMENRIKGLTDTLLKLPKYMDNPEAAYADAKKMVTGQSAQNPFTGFSGRPLK